MNILKKTILFGVLTAMLPIASIAESAYMRLIGDADKAIARQDWTSAEQSILEALRTDPSNPGNVMLLSNLGMIQFYTGRDSLALASLTDAHRIAPASVTVLANRARVFTAIGLTDRAVEDYDLIERLDSTAWQPYLYRGLISLAIGDTENAGKDLHKLESLRPDDIDTHIALAALASALEKPDDALPHFQALIRRDPQAEYYAGRAFCLLQKGQLQDAADDIASGLELDDCCAELYVCRALLNKKRYRNDDALADAQRAIDLGANRARIKMLLGL